MSELTRTVAEALSGRVAERDVWDEHRQLTCACCGLPIRYSVADVVFLHEHNGRYFCTDSITGGFATP